MKNSNSSLGKMDKKQPQNTKKKNSKSPLRVRDINTLSSSSSISIDASRGGCLRFILSHPHSSSSSVINAKIGAHKPKPSVRTPKSAPNIKKLRGNPSNLQNLEKPIDRKVDKSRKKLVPGSRSGVSETSSSRVPAVRFGGECELEKLELVDSEINNESDLSSPIFPIQASVSPEIQGGCISAMTGTCYAAGHLLSGVSDRRKCRPRGILTVGDNDLFQASIHWFSSPNHDEKRVKENVFSVPFTSVTCSSASPLSSPVFSSDTSNSTSSSMSCALSPESSSNFRGLLGPSFDHLVCSPSRSFPILSPVSKGSIGSGNVIQTPTSTSSSSSLPLWDSGKDSVSRPPLFERELDSLTELLAEASFEFTPLVEPSCSVDFNTAHPDINTESLGLEMCDVDESDCCRCFSDEEDPYKHEDPFE